MRSLRRLLLLLCLPLLAVAADSNDPALLIGDASGGSALIPLRQALLAVSRENRFAGREFAIIRMTPEEALKKFNNNELELIIMETRDIPSDFNGVRRKFAAEALVCYTAVGNPLRSISLRQLKEIWQAEQPEWKKYNGEFNTITRQGLTLSAGGFVEARFLGGVLRSEGVFRSKDISRAFLFCTPSSLLCAPYVEKCGTGIIKLAVDNVAPNAENIASGSYPLNLRYEILSKQQISAAAFRFLELLDSPEYSSMIRESGLIKTDATGEKK